MNKQTYRMDGWDIEDIIDEAAEIACDPSAVPVDRDWLKKQMARAPKAELKKAYKRLHRQRAALDTLMKQVQKAIDHAAIKAAHDKAVGR